MHDTIEIVSDPTGFPMIWREEVTAFVHWLPVTKVQFEHFLCAAPDAYFDAAWYGTILGLNPRVTPRGVGAGNYWQALMTGVHPSEAQRFASWCGDGYRLPTESEWTALYLRLDGQSALDLATAGILDGVDSRAHDLLSRIDGASRTAAERGVERQTLADQMLLRHGAMEWVRSGEPPSGWSSRGEPFPAFCGNLESPHYAAARLALDLESARFPAAGFRLLRARATASEAEPRNG
jgi:hypothetical protein